MGARKIDRLIRLATRKRLPVQSAWRFYVYALFDGDTCTYVGKGTGRRLKASERVRGHSGYEVARFHNEDDAYDAERAIISELKPSLNRMGGGNGSRATPVRVPRRQPPAQRRPVARFLIEWYKTHQRFAPDSSTLEMIRAVANGPRC